MELITEKKQQRLALYAALANRYRQLVKVSGAQPSAVTRKVAAEFGISLSTMYKVIKIYNLNREKIDRSGMMEALDKILEVKKMSEAVRDIAHMYECSEGYIYYVRRTFR